jgi:hypothetical protein
MNNHAAPHPVGLLPDYMRNLAYAIAAKLEVDVGMAFSTLLSGMASAVQGLKVVKRPDGGIEPLSLFSIVLAAPTAGKTRTHKLVHRAHNAQDVHRYQEYQQAKKGRRPFVLGVAVSEVADEAYSGGAYDSALSGDPRLRWVILQNSTNRALLEALEGVGEASSMSSHEGQNVLNSDVLKRHLETLDTLFDGDDKTILTRAKGDFVMSAQATLVLLVMAQQDIFGNYVRKYGDYARGIGFFARVLFTSVPLYPTPLDPRIQFPADCLDNYERQVTTYLDAQRNKLEAGITAREEMAFSPEACQLYWQLAQEHQRLTSTVYWHIQDAANRALQNVIRISAIMHAFSGETGDIQANTLAAAYAVVEWHLAQFSELFPPKPLPLPKQPKPSTRERRLQRQFEDMRTITDCIIEVCCRGREPDALKSRVFVGSGLYNARFRTALMRLTDEGHVLESGEGKEARLSIVPQRGGLSISPPTSMYFSSGSL